MAGRTRPENPFNLPAIKEELDEEFFSHIKNPRQRAFLRAFAETGALVLAEQLSGVPRTAHHHWLKVDRVYIETFEEAKQLAADAWESEVARRAFHGTDNPIFYKGKEVGTRREFSDLLTMFMLNATRPEKFHRVAEKHVESATYTINITNYSSESYVPPQESREQIKKENEQKEQSEPIEVKPW